MMLMLFRDVLFLFILERSIFMKNVRLKNNIFVKRINEKMQAQNDVIFVPPKSKEQEELFQPQLPQYYPPPMNFTYLYRPSVPVQDKIFFWDKPRLNFNHKLFEAVDVNEIVKNGDIEKIEFYLPKIVDSRILSSSENIGTDAVLKSFSVMQMGAQYLLKKKKNRYLPFGASPTADGDGQLIAMNEALIAQTNNQLNDMQNTINQLEMQSQRLLSEIRKMRIKRKKYMKKYIAVKRYIIRKELKTKEHKKKEKLQKKKRMEELSEGQVPPEDIKKYTTLHVQIAK